MTDQNADYLQNRNAFILTLPKVELHVHLEGTITPKAWYDLLMKHHQERFSLEVLEDRFRFDSFMNFLHTYRDVLRSIKDPSDFYDITFQYLRQAASQGVCHSEVMITPYFFTRNGMALHEILGEIDRAAKRAEQAWGISMTLIFDGPRNFGCKVVREVFQQATEDKTGRVVGVGIGGDEKNYPAIDFVDEFDFARAQGLKAIAHAGEVAGEVSMIDAIQGLKVSRLGHCLGIKANTKLEALILENEITLDLCPNSNVATRVIPTLEEHPFCEYLERGYPIALNSDDPGFFHTDILQEYLTMADLHNLTKQDLIRVSENSIRGSFLDQRRKKTLLEQLQKLNREHAPNW